MPELAFNSRVAALGFTPDGSALYAVCAPMSRGRGEHLILGWATTTRRGFTSPAVRLPRHAGWAFSPDCQVAAGCGGAVVTLLKTGGWCVTSLDWDGVEPLTCLAFSPDGQTLATGGQLGTVKLWPWRRLLDA
jgi:WD40 repeat protein